MKRKHIYAVLTVVLFIPFCQLWAQSKSPVQESMVNFDKLIANLKVTTVIGEPIRSGKAIIIPFARVSFGMGAGGSMTGYGGGMGGKAIPAGILIIEGEDVRVELFPIEEKKPSFLQEMLPILLKMLPEMLGDKSPFFSKKSPSSQSQTQEKSDNFVGEPSLDQAKTLFDKEKYTEALEVVNALVDGEPGNAEFHAWKGLVMGQLAQGNPMDMMKYGMGAMQEFERAVELDSENATARFGRGVGRLMAPEGFGRDLDGAVEDLEIACKKDPFADAYYYLGTAYKSKGLQDKAKAAFTKALELKPDYPEAAKALAEIE